MNRGIVLITPEYISKALGLPAHWRIRNIQMKEGGSYAEMMIEGPEFPDDAEGVKKVLLIVHKESIRFEVEEIK